MQKRIILAIIINMLIILGGLGIMSYVFVSGGIKRSLNNRLALATVISRYVDSRLESNLTRLFDISVSGRIDLNASDWGPAIKALKSAYEYSIFTDGLFLVDRKGDVVLGYPQQQERVNVLSIPYIRQVMDEKKPLISDVYMIEPTKRKVIFAIVPLKDTHGEVIGAVCGEINPTGHVFTEIIKSVSTSASIDLIDSHGVIISSSDPARILTTSDHDRFMGRLINDKKGVVRTCHRCHIGNEANRSREIMAFAPLSSAPWGVAIKEASDAVFAPTIHLRNGFVALSLIATATALILALGLSNSIVKPVRRLIGASEKIGKGHLAEPVEVFARDEIGILARSFDQMREKLRVSLEDIQKQNVELERRVARRTADLEKSRAKLSRLLVKLINAQEEERKRIARELHDDTSQTLNATLLSLDFLNALQSGDHALREKLGNIREQVLSILKGVHRMIKDLRPPVLDDFGLESAIRWVLETHLAEKGVDVYFDSGGTGIPLKGADRDLDFKKMEFLLFRVVQEAIINIDRHAAAKNVFLTVIARDEGIEVEVDDDGIGFDTGILSGAPGSGRESGFGVAGMRERVSLLDGTFTINSKPGQGTYINVFVPFQHKPADGEIVLDG